MVYISGNTIIHQSFFLLAISLRLCQQRTFTISALRVVHGGERKRIQVYPLFLCIRSCFMNAIYLKLFTFQLSKVKHQAHK